MGGKKSITERKGHNNKSYGAILNKPSVNNVLLSRTSFGYY